MTSEDARYKILCILEQNPATTQRQLAEELGVSLGKVNYCLQALVAKGFVKIKNFSQSKNRARYFYLLTPKGIEKRALLAKLFLHRKLLEYEALRREIEEIQQDLKILQ